MRHFKLGVITDEVSQDLDEVIAFAAKYNLDTLELRSIKDKPIHQLSNEELKEIRSKAEQAGLSICALSSPIFKCDLGNTEELEQHYQMIERIMEAAEILGASMVRGFSFWSKGSFDDHKEAIAEHIRYAAGRLQTKGLTFVLEFDPSVYATNARTSAELIQLVDCNNVRALYDPGNTIWDPERELPFPEGYQYVKPYIAHIHLKDARRSGDEVECVAMGRGEVDYEGLFQQLVDDGYDGYLILETHYRLTVQLTEEQLKRPSGQSFSAGGYEASVECIESLLAMKYFH